MIELYKPDVSELGYRQGLLSDAETMAYNRKWGGTIDWPKNKWAFWANKWLKSDERRYFYRYIYDTAADQFVGEAAFHYEEEYGMHVINLIVEAQQREKGYGRKALSLLIQEARNLSIPRLCDDIAADNPSIGWFKSMGFEEQWRTEDVVLLTIDLKEE